ncbi:MAG: alpha/beta hydrolase [Streptosporangiales bacterium]|nr:alpha/beta hydrolase [Streptosporangiales bacterium]MBO0891907.1 alpha/beta hydrolase [Acidothermales bacterium]
MTIAYERIAVPVDGGKLTVGVWGDSGPVVLAVHGITGSHLAWSVVAEQLAGRARLAAVDLRGRGLSADLPAPYGMAAHAADCVAVLDALRAGSAVVAGHSMGGFVSLVLGDLRPERVERIVLVDGGPPLPLPAGVEPEEQLAAVIGPAATRLQLRFADRDEYLAYWRGHPAFERWTPAVEAYADYDLTGVAPELRSRVSTDAVRDDSVDLYTGDALAGAWARLRRPTTMLRAERGMLDEPTALYSDPAPIAARIPVRTVPGTNHYTIVFDETSAAEIAATLTSRT